jgi:hypothetical protein
MMRAILLLLAIALFVIPSSAQGRLPDVSMTIKGDLVMPAPLRTPLFKSITESIGQAGLTFQVPVYKGLGVGIGANMTWLALKERALSPFINNGDIRRLVAYGKVHYERYTGEKTFYELSARSGVASYEFSCEGCGGRLDPMLYVSVQAAYYVHATENLAFGMLLGHDFQSGRFSASDLGLSNFPGRTETSESGPYQNLLFGLGFSTRLRRSERDVITW